MLKHNLPSVFAVLSFLLLWQLVCIIDLVPAYMLPSPVDVVLAFIREWPLLWDHALITLQEALIGLFFGVCIGFVAAILMDRFEIIFYVANVPNARV